MKGRPEEVGTEDTCRNCWQRVVCVNFALGPAWVHQPAGASFQDGQHEYCHMTVAEPERKGRESDAFCPEHDTTLPCAAHAGDHAAGLHTTRAHAECPRCATPPAQIDAKTVSAGDDSLNSPNEGETP